MNIKLTPEERYKRNMERLARLRPIDDTLMRELFRDDIPLAQFVLRIITGRDDLVIVKMETQYDMKHLLGTRSVCLDVLAVDSEGRKYNLEIQRSDLGAAPKRARFHSSSMDLEFLDAGQDFEELPVTYVIFITENDVRGLGKPIYFFTRTDTETGEFFGDDEYIIFVNGAYQNADDHSELAKLIHDFKCTNAGEMYLGELAEKTRYCKESAKGVSNMCKIMEELREEGRQEGRQEGIEEGRQEGRQEGIEEGRYKNSCLTAVELLKLGVNTVEQIAKCTNLPVETVRELEEKYVNGSSEN